MTYSFEKTAHLKEFDGVPVDLSRAEVIEAIKSSPIEVKAVFNYNVSYTKPIIRFNKKSYELCRTDLLDDIRTSLLENFTIEEWRKHYLDKAQICLGARIKNKSFCVIDSLTDG